VPAELPNIKEIFRRFSPFNMDDGYEYPSTGSVLLGRSARGELSLVRYIGLTNFESIAMGSEPPTSYLQLSGWRLKRQMPHIAVLNHWTLLAHCPSAVPGTPQYEAPADGSILLEIPPLIETSPLRLLFVVGKGRLMEFWDIQEETLAKAPLHYVQLSAGDSGIDPRTFPLQTDCRRKLTRASDLTFNL